MVAFLGFYAAAELSHFVEIVPRVPVSLWSEFASAFAAQVHSLCASVTAVYLSFFVLGRVLTRLD